MKLEDIKIGGKYKPVAGRDNCGSYLAHKYKARCIKVTDTTSGWIAYDILDSEGVKLDYCSHCFSAEDLEPYEGQEVEKNPEEARVEEASSEDVEPLQEVATDNALVPKYKVGQRLYDRNGHEGVVERADVVYVIKKPDGSRYFQYEHSVVEEFSDKPVVKQMTHAEVEAELGFKVKIVE